MAAYGPPTLVSCCTAPQWVEGGVSELPACKQLGPTCFLYFCPLAWLAGSLHNQLAISMTSCA